MKISAIVKPDKVYINITDYPYLDDYSNYLFDGGLALGTSKQYWKAIKKLPTVITKIHKKYSYTDGYQILDWAKDSGNPLKVNADFFDEEAGNDGIKGLYEPITIDVPERQEDVSFTIETIATVSSNWEFVHAPKGVQYLTVDEIENHLVMLQDKPCSLSVKESYNIIREYVKLNFDRNNAVIESDYDFHFKVGKKIQLCKTESYKVITDAFSKRPKEITNYRDTRNITVLDIATEKKWGPLCEAFTGKNHAELNDNIKKYLTTIMEDINRPLKDCPTCRGKGVLTNND